MTFKKLNVIKFHRNKDDSKKMRVNYACIKRTMTRFAYFCLLACLACQPFITYNNSLSKDHRFYMKDTVSFSLPPDHPYIVNTSHKRIYNGWGKPIYGINIGGMYNTGTNWAREMMKINCCPNFRLTSFTAVIGIIDFAMFIAELGLNGIEPHGRFLEPKEKSLVQMGKKRYKSGKSK